MLRFSANLSMLFTEYDFLERFDKAALSGFRGVEFMFPYDNDIEVLKRKLRDNNLEHTLHNLPAGDWATAWKWSIATVLMQYSVFCRGWRLCRKFWRTVNKISTTAPVILPASSNLARISGLVKHKKSHGSHRGKIQHS